MTSFDVYVPRPGSDLARMVAPASGMVGTPIDGDRIKVDFEGNRNGACNIITWCDRVSFAAGRHATNYPTVARMHVAPDDVTLVGTYDDLNGIVDVNDVIAACEWLGVDGLDPDQLKSTGSRHQMRAEFAAAWRTKPEMRPMLRRQARRMHAEDLVN